jgi:glycosyltransferase involved in cell wall biosynthesis
MHVLYVGPFALRTGYAQAAHDYMLALHREGISLEIQPTEPCNTDDLEERYHELFALTRGHPDHAEEAWEKPTHVIIHAVPAALPMIAADYGDAIKIAITTWETSHMPIGFVDAIDQAFDIVVVPSVFCAHTFDRLGLQQSCVIPHCFDPAHWPTVPPLGCDRCQANELNCMHEKPYAFYSILGWNERKNPIGLLKAYYAEFSSDDNVVLRLKANARIDDLEALEMALGYDDIPAIEIEDTYFNHNEMVAFHHANDCFVTAARGEGWNLPAFEAAILGRHVIAPDFGGHLDFCKFSSYRGVNYTETPAIVPPEIVQVSEGIRAVTQTAPSGITARQHWAEPDLGDLQQAMRRTYEHRIQPTTHRSILEDKFSYATVGKQLAELITRSRT